MALSDLTASAGEAVAGRIAREWRVSDPDVLVRIRDAVNAAVSAERERCAHIVATKFEEARDTEFDLGFETARKVFAAAILNPSNK